MHIEFTVYYTLNISWLKDSVSVQRLATGWTIRDSNYGREKYFLLSKRTHTRSGTHTAWYSMYTGVLSLGREADHVPPSGAEVKNDVEASWNVMAHAQKPDFAFRRNGRVHLNRRVISSVDYWQPRCTHQLLLSVVMLDAPCSEVVWKVLATHSIRLFPLHFPSRASPCVITFQLESSYTSAPSYLASWCGEGQIYLIYLYWYRLHVRYASNQWFFVKGFVFW